MPAIAFARRPKVPINMLPGFPRPAKPCRCRECLVHDVECVMCGRLPRGVIAATWQAAAQRMMASNGPSSAPQRLTKAAT